MPRTPRPAPPRAALVLPALLALALAATGCQGQRALDPAPRVSSSAPASRPPTATSQRPATPGTGSPARPTAAASTAFPEAYAVSCAGHPSGEQVIALLRRTAGMLPAGMAVTVTMAPQCSGTWQYTVISVPDREPLHVVTRGEPAGLRLVTAGTNVCTIEVRTQAPRGLLALAQCEAA